MSTIHIRFQVLKGKRGNKRAIYIQVCVTCMVLCIYTHTRLTLGLFVKAHLCNCQSTKIVSKFKLVAAFITDFL